MLFNSFEFIFIFLPITFFLYFYFNRKRLALASKAWLVFASLFFYSWWNAAYLPLILGSILFNFAVGTTLCKSITDRLVPTRKAILFVGIAANILLLAYYKYVDFFIGTTNAILSTHLDFINVVLPLGISFFTFTQIAYLVDAYRGEIKEMDYLNYSLFVTFFPHLLAGPILHHKEMMPQFDNIKNKVLNYKNISVGLFLFSIGLFKKVIIADEFAVWANAGFESHMPHSFFEAWATSLSYTFQLYFDFSGYTDMALGAALLFNIKLPVNFNSPYKALDIQDFWRRWHITLSRFLRDYVYIPLGGNKASDSRVYANLFLTFLIGGLWHGAAWTFVFWGALHGAAIAVHRFYKKFNISMPNIIAWLITFNFINASWVFFRAKSFDDALNILGGMVGLNGLCVTDKFKQGSRVLDSISIQAAEFMANSEIKAQTGYWILGGLLFVLLTKNSNLLAADFKTNNRTLFFCVLLFCYSLLSMSKISEFLYFNF